MKGKIQAARIKDDLKNKLEAIAKATEMSMTELIKREFRDMLKENNLPTI